MRASFLLSLLTLVIGVMSSVALYRWMLGSFKNEVQKSLIHLADAGSVLIDPQQHRQFTDREQEKSPAYLQAIAPLDAFLKKANGELKFVYTCIRKDQKIYFVLDPTPPGIFDAKGVEQKSHIMQLYDEASPALQMAFETLKSQGDVEPYVDAWGSFVSGYSPVFDAKGQLVCVLGVDLVANDYHRKLHVLVLGGWLGSGLALLSSLLVGIVHYRLRLGSEQALVQRERIHRMVELEKDVLEEAASGQPLTRVAELLCRRGETLVEGFSMAIFHWCHGERCWELVAAPQLPPAFWEEFQALSPSDPDLAPDLAKHCRNGAMLLEGLGGGALGGGIDLLLSKYEFQCELAEPILDSRGELLGLLGLVGLPPPPPSPSILYETLKSLAHVASVVLERHESDASLLRSESRFRLLYERSPDAIWLVEGQQIKQANPAALSLFEAPDLAGLPAIGELMPPQQPDGQNSAEAFQGLFQKAQESGSHRFEWIFCRRSGEVFPAEVLLTVIPQATMPLIHVVLRDISDRLRVEKELQNARSLELVNKTKTEFLTNMSQEIREPMTSILGYADLLLEPNLGESDRQESVRVIRRHGERLLSVITNILDMAKLEAQQMELNRSWVSPQRVLAEMLQYFDGRAREKSLALTAQSQGMVPERIECDPLRLRQVLTYLIDNALRYTASGRVELLFRCNRQQIFFEVTDSGPGIPAEQQKRLFSFNNQAIHSDDARQGLGLGLVISQRLAFLMKGDLRLQSQPGKGSTFTLALPIGDLSGIPQGPGREIQVDRKLRPGQPQVALKGRILLVEDSLDFQHLMVQFLHLWGLDVTTATQGQQAYDLAIQRWQAREAFDLILLDMELPEMDGYALTARLRERVYAGPIVAVTAHALSSDRDRCMRAGCNDHVGKPVDWNRLRRILETYLA